MDSYFFFLWTKSCGATIQRKPQSLVYLTIITRVRVAFEIVVANSALRASLAIIISYPTSPSGIIVLLKTPTKYREFFPTLFVKQSIFSLFLI